MAIYNDYSNPNISMISDSIFNAEFDESGLPRIDGENSLVGTVSWD
jgi:hypothetical protein